MTHHIGRTKKTIRNSKRKRWIFEEKKINDFPFCPKGGNLGGNDPNNEIGGGGGGGPGTDLFGYFFF